MQYITGSKLYNYIMCEHRVWRDVYGPQEEKIKETNPFVQMLWDRGVAHEDNVIEEVGEYLDLSKIGFDNAFIATVKAMKDGVPLIYQGVLTHGNLRGIPDLIKRMPDGTYLPIEIKSGMGMEGMSDDEDEENGKPKKSYAVQLALYVDLLECLGFEHTNRGQIIDGHLNNVIYDLNRQLGVNIGMK